MPATSLIVPCYDEAERLDEVGLAALLGRDGRFLVFVDDGSRDDTAGRLRSLCERHPGRAELLVLERNRGKGEAVRRGLRRGLELGAGVVGFVDADLATPPSEVDRMEDLLREDGLDVVIGSRIRFLGAAIDRSEFRHYAGRLFATAASLLLDLAVYDTQCGAKLFRRTAALEAALAEPFRSRWCFDVELLGRLLTGAPGVAPVPPDRMRELPLRSWRDVRGSKLRPSSLPVAAWDLLRVGAAVRRRRRRLASSTVAGGGTVPREPGP